MVLSHHKKLARRRATSDNTPTRIILPQKLKRQLLSNRRLMKRINARYWNERRYETRKTFFEEEDEKEVLRSVCIHFDMTRLPRFAVSKSFFGGVCIVCLVVYHNDLHKTTRFGHFPTKFKN